MEQTTVHDLYIVINTHTQCAVVYQKSWELTFVPLIVEVNTVEVFNAQ